MKRFSLIFFFTCVLIATILFNDPHQFPLERVIYIIFLVISGWQLYIFRYKRPASVLDLPMPRWYTIWIQLLIAFVIYGLYRDFRNPNFSIVTILNHPLAVLTVVPVFAFMVGYQTVNIDKFIKFLCVTGGLFCLFLILSVPDKNVFAQCAVCSYAVLPLSLFAMDRKKYRLFTFLLIALSVVYSQVSDSRSVVLRILIFFGLLVGMSMVKRWSPLKLVIMLIAGFMIYQFLVNLQDWLLLFKSYVHSKNFDDDDTRTFLYEEVWGDMKSSELLFGRGFLGTYFSPYFLSLRAYNLGDGGGDSWYRFSVEVGFLQFLLKGGFAWFLLYITPLVATVYKGLFTRHNSRIAFYIAVYILCELLIIFIENIPAWHFQFFIIFFLAGYGYRQTALETRTVPATDEELYHNTLLLPGN